jgi:hypothetical protein
MKTYTISQVRRLERRLDARLERLEALSACVDEFLGPEARRKGCRCNCPVCRQNAPPDHKMAAANDRQEEL